jgi:hypothetical protein
MENNKREPFKKYKELRVYFSVNQYSVIQYDCEGMEFAKAFDWFKFSSRGATFKDKNSGMEIHFKYSSVDRVDGHTDSRALILEDVELYTPFIKDDNNVKFITWKEWNEKYNTEEICKRITTVTDERLKEHNTDLMYILDKLCTCAGDRNFDHPHRFIKVEPRYQDNEYSIHHAAAGFKWHYGAKMYDCIRYTFEYEAKNRTINIIITKDETWYTPSSVFSIGFLSNHISMPNQVDAYSIDVEFNKDYSISKVTVKNKNKENLLKFMEMGNPVIKNTIRQIRDYINAKLVEKQLTSRINTSSEEDMFVQTWNFSPRADVRPYVESVRKMYERAEAYNIDTEINPTAYAKIWTYLNTKMTGLNSWMIKKGEPFRFEYNNGPFKKTEIVNVRTVENNSFINLLFQSTDMNAVENVYNMEITFTFDDNGNVKDYAMINRELIDKFEEKNIINLLKFLEEFSFSLNKYGDIYNQLKNECDSIYNHSITHDRTSTCNGYVLSISSGTLLEATREKFYFHFENFATFHRITIEILDPNREKLRITVGVEGSELVSIAVNPGFDKFDALVGTIHNTRVRRLVAEIFNKLYKGEE